MKPARSLLSFAETQLTKALPKMATAANTPELKSAFTAHLEETKEQLVRLNQIGEKLPTLAKSINVEAKV